jgi:hypothetical protein
MITAVWQKRRGQKAEESTALGWLDYRMKLARQNPQAKHRVLYPMSASYLCATVLKTRAISVTLGTQTVKTGGFVADYKLFSFETNKGGEAFFLASILNAPTTDRIIKPMQSRGQWGPRDTCRKVLELPIPRYDSKKASHRRLSDLGKTCTAKVEKWVRAGGPGKTNSVGKLRSTVRAMLAPELEDIDAAVRKIVR